VLDGVLGRKARWIDDGVVGRYDGGDLGDNGRRTVIRRSGILRARC
jgi:hypothetical protein